MNRLLGRLVDPLPATFRRHVSLVAIIAIAIPYMVLVTVLHSQAISPIDEWVYLDYLDKLPTQGIVHDGENIGQKELVRMACVGETPSGRIGPPCASSYSLSQLHSFPYHGVSTASPYTPLYFAVTWVVGEAIQVVPGLHPGEGWRLTGTLWLVLSLLFLFRLFRQFGIRHGPAFAIGLAYVASPYAWWTYSYVSTDAPAVLVGSALLTLAVDLARGRRVGWAIIVVGTIGTMIKITNVLGVALALLYLAIVAIRQRSDPTQRPMRLLWPALVALVVGAVGQIIWLRLVHLLAVSNLRADQGGGVPLDISELFLQTTNFLPGTITSNPLGPFLPGFVYTPLSWLCVAGVVGSVLMLRRVQPHVSMVIAVGIASVAAAPLLAIALEVATSSYFQLPPRYGATILPGTVLLLASVLRFRPATVAVTAYSAALLVVGVWLSWFLATLA